MNYIWIEGGTLVCNNPFLTTMTHRCICEINYSSLSGMGIAFMAHVLGYSWSCQSLLEKTWSQTTQF